MNTKRSGENKKFLPSGFATGVHWYCNQSAMDLLLNVLRNKASHGVLILCCMPPGGQHKTETATDLSFFKEQTAT